MSDASIIPFPEPVGPEEEPDPVLPTYQLNDAGNADLFVDTWKEKFRYVPERGDWFFWNGNRWALDIGRAGTAHAIEMLRKTLPISDAEKKWYHQSQNAAKLSNMLKIAESHTAIQAPLEDFDTDPYLLNTPGGIVDLRTATMSSCRPEALMTRTTNCTPDMDAREGSIPQFAKFIKWAFSDDKDMMLYIQQLAGLSLIGSTELEHVVPFCFGMGRNGKSTLLNLIAYILGNQMGKGYAWTAKKDLVTVNRNGFSTSNFDRAGLQGIRFLTIEELGQGDKLNEESIKSFAGGDNINAAFKGKDEFVFKPQFTMWMQGNHEPQVHAGGDGFWKRMRQIPFTQQVEAGQEDGELPEKLRSEAPGILMWMILGAEKYLQTKRLVAPAKVELATSEYRIAEDDITQFLMAACEGGVWDKYLAVASELREAYEIWCESEGLRPCKAIDFYKGLTGKRLDGHTILKSAKTMLPQKTQDHRKGQIDKKKRYKVYENLCLNTEYEEQVISREYFRRTNDYGR